MDIEINTELKEKVIFLLKADNKVRAVSLVQSVYREGLNSSKDIVEWIEKGIQKEKNQKNRVLN